MTKTPYDLDNAIYDESSHNILSSSRLISIKSTRYFDT